MNTKDYAQALADYLKIHADDVKVIDEIDMIFEAIGSDWMVKLKSVALAKPIGQEMREFYIYKMEED